MAIREYMTKKASRPFFHTILGMYTVGGVAAGMIVVEPVRDLAYSLTSRVHVHFWVYDGKIDRDTVRVHGFQSVLEKDEFIVRHGKPVYDSIYPARKVAFEDPDPVCYYSSGGYEWTETVANLPCP